MAARGQAGGPAADLPRHFAEEMGRLTGPDFPKHLVLAVSGGGDSMAMLYLAAPWARVMGITLYVCTVDHGLREDAAEEAALVARACAELGLFHQTLDWRWDRQGNLQEAAREGRLDAIMRWKGAVRHVLMAHTEDDQAETFLLRLARGSGVDGLSGMAPRAERMQGMRMDPLHAHPDGPPWPPTFEGGMVILRPLLGVSRVALRHYLTVLKIEHVDDPTNDDPRFDRVKVRRALPALAELGLTTERLAATAAHMERAREALMVRARAADAACRLAEGRMISDVVYDRDAFATLERETQLRLLAAAVQYVADQPQRPRLAALETALDRASAGGATTLHGAYILPHKARLFVCPEYERIKDMRPEGGYWRGRFFVGEKDIRPLGVAGAAQLRDETDLPARVLWPAPALWDGDRVLASPRIGHNPHWNPESWGRGYTALLTSR
ncbi:MAG: tRNA lysidine(34) synthetase TilS [Pseudomonadota bacterium]